MDQALVRLGAGRIMDHSSPVVQYGYVHRHRSRSGGQLGGCAGMTKFPFKTVVLAHLRRGLYDLLNALWT